MSYRDDLHWIAFGCPHHRVRVEYNIEGEPWAYCLDCMAPIAVSVSKPSTITVLPNLE